jgi:hypothetical protein
MAVWFLDNDDEITDAVARLRSTDDERVVFVVPPGSRIATGRINFKLLAREAEARELALAVASPDEQVRAMAASAGVLASATSDAAEAALERGDEPEAGLPPALPATASAETATTAPAAEQAASPLSWRSRRMRVATLLVLVAVVVGWALAAQVLPSAEITLRPRLAALGPLEVTVTASADVEALDAEAGTIPLTVISIPLELEERVEASGVQVTETKARGEVVFTSEGRPADKEIPAGTRVETPAQIRFRTTETAVLPASEEGVPTQVAVPVEALEGGEAGNVRAEAISEAPSLADQGISVSNPAATTGGRTESAPLVEPRDFDDAVVNLGEALEGKLAAWVRDPANAPAGLTVFAETAERGPLSFQPLASEIVGTSVDGFTLAATATGEVLAVDEALVDEVLEERLRTSLPEAMALRDASIVVEHEPGEVEDGGRIRFSGLASATMEPRIDPEALLARIAGLPVSEAQAILDEIGSATVNVWPGFLGDLPNDRERITLDVLEASATE